MNYHQKSKDELISMLNTLLEENDALKQALHTNNTKHIEAEEKQTESRKMLQLVMNSIPQFIFWKDTNSVFLGCNENFARVAGLKSAKEIVGKTDYDLAWKKEEADFFRKVDQEIMNSGEARYHIIEPQLQADGKKAWLETNKVPMYNSSGKIVGILGTFEDITERKKSEEDLIESEKRNSILLNATLDLAMLIDYTGKVIAINDAMANSLGYSADKMINQSVFNLLPPELEKSRKKWGEKALKSKKPVRFTDTRDNRWFDNSIYPILNEDGKMYQFAIFSKDITKIKKATEALQASENRFKTLSSIATEGLMIHENGIVLDVNLAFTKLIGFSKPEDIIGKNAFEITPLTPESKQLIKEHMQKKSIETYDITLIGKNGELIEAETRAAEIIYNEKEARLVYMTDITNRKKIEVELLKEKEKAERNEIKFSKLFHISPEPQTVTSLQNGQFVMVNDAFLESTGYNLDEIINHTSIEINAWLSVEDRQKWVQELKKHGKVRSLEIPFRTKLFGIREYLVSSDIIELDGNKCAVNIYLDITERKQMEAELTKSKEKAEESDRLKTAFLQNMSHEIRTPMNAIMGFSSLLAENYDNKENLEQFSGIINQRCSDLLEIINDILDIAKIESGQVTLNIEDCNINELFAELNLFFNEHQKRIGKEHILLNLHYQSKDVPFIVQTDKVKLKQILINLIGNAFKFTEKGTIECGYTIKGNKLIFYVSDTGIGIPTDKQDKIFERFAQLNNPKIKLNSGTGLGLSIARGLTNLLGGEIWLNSKSEDENTGIAGGTTFEFSIEYFKSEFSTEPIKSTPNYQSHNFKDKTILIVEDDMYNAKYLTEILSKTGINILHAETGKKAVEISVEKDIDLVLMDIRLPDINGYEATKEIKLLKPKLNIIAQTAYAAHDEKHKALSEGCNDYISKPTDKAQLISLISKYLGFAEKVRK